MDGTTQRARSGFMENAVGKVILIGGGLALGICLGASSREYDHFANAALTLLSSGAFFVIDSKRSVGGAVQKAIYMAPTILAGTYVIEFLNQLA